MMKVSTRVRYGMRALAMLGARHGLGPVSLASIAREQHLPVKYLERLFVLLKASGLVEAVRGAGGGYVLAKAPDEIRLLDVFAVLEGPPDPVECLQDDITCPHEGECLTRDIWQEVAQAVRGVLAEHTLADLQGDHFACQN